MRQYTEAEKQYYMGIIKAISEHADFGKRNPVDIGIDCGYTEEDEKKGNRWKKQRG